MEWTFFKSNKPKDLEKIELIYADTDGNVLIDNAIYSSFNKKFFLNNSDSNLFAIAWRPLINI